MSLIVRDHRWIATDDRYVQLNGRTFGFFHSGKKLFIHPSNCLLMAPLGAHMDESLADELLHLAHNELQLQYGPREEGTVSFPSKPIGVMLESTYNYIKDYLNKSKKETTFYFFLKELTLELKWIKTITGDKHLLCRELYVPDIVVGSGQDGYIAAKKLGCNLKEAFHYAHLLTPTVGTIITTFPISEMKSYLGVDHELSFLG